MRLKQFIFALVAMLLGFASPSLAQVAKVGNTEYATIDEAIAKWTNGTTLTLLADVTLSDVIQLSSTEHHILDLGTYTMTAASKKDAIQIVNNGRSSASYALDIKADATNPGGITASGKAVVRTTGKSGVKDRPIIRFYGGVFTGTNVVYHSGSNGTNCPQFWFYGGVFNGTIYANRALFQFYGGTFNGALQISVDSSAYALIAGGTFSQLSNLYGSALTSDKFTIGSKKGVYDREVYVDDNGYYVVAAAEPAEGIEAAVAKNPGTNEYLAYSKVKTDGKLNYTDAVVALKNNNTTSSKVTVYVEELDLTGVNFKGTIVVPEGKTVKITNAPEGLKTEGNAVIVKPVAKIGDVEYMTFDEAYSAAKNGDVINLFETAVISKTMANYNKKTITVKANGLETAFLVKSSVMMGTFSGMTIETDGTCITFGENASDYNPTVDITGGTFKGGTSAITVVSGLVRIADGVFSADESAKTIVGGVKNVNVNGGKFYNFDPTSYIPNNRIAQKGADGYWTVAEAAAQIGDVKYASLASAIDAAQAGETVTLLRDINLGDITSALVVKKSITIDGEGYWTITVNSVNDTFNKALFAPRGPISYTFKNLTIDLKNAASDMAAFNMKYGGTLENVTVKGAFGQAVSVGMAFPVSVANCKFDGATWGVYANASGVKVNVTGTTFNTTGALYLHQYGELLAFTGNMIAAGSYIETDATVDVSQNFWNGNNATGNAPAATQLKGNNIICDTYYTNNANGALSNLTDNGVAETPVIKIDIDGVTYEYGPSKLSLISKLLGSSTKGDNVKITLLDDITLEDGLQIAAYIETAGNIVITGKTVEIDLGGKTLAGFIQINSNVTATIKNGTVNSSNKNYAAIDVNGATTLEDLTVKSAVKAFKVTDDATLTVKTGTYSSDPSAYLAEGYWAEANADGTFGVIVAPAATIGTQKYASLEEAFAAAEEGQTITLVADAAPVLTSQRAITKAAVIDLNGKTLTLKEDDLYFGTTTFKNGTIVVDPSVKPSTAVFWMFANQTLTFDNVKIVATGVTGTYLIGLEGDNSDLNLLNGSEILVENTTALDLDIICVNGTNTCDIKVENSKVNVKNLDGRVFFRGNYTVNNSEVNLSGITKAGFRIEAGQTLSIDGTSKVNIEGEPRDGGIHLTDITSTYTKAETATVSATLNEVKAIATIGTQKYETLAAALAAATEGQTITLAADATEDVTIEKKVTIDGAGKTYTGAMTLKANATIKNVNFDGKGFNGYAITTRGAQYLTIEGGSAKNYGYGFVQLASATALTTVKNVTVSDMNYGVKVDYSNAVVLDSVDIAAGVAAVLNSNYGEKTITVKNSKLNILGTWKRNDTKKTTYVFEGANTIGEFKTEDALDNFKLAADATLTAPEGKTVTTDVENSAVQYKDGAYTVVPAVAKAGNVCYLSLQEAINAVQNGDTVTILTDIKENVTLKEKTGLYYTIDGAGKTMDGTITVTPLSDTNDNRRITIKNIKFVNTADAGRDFISSVATNHYPRITVEDCNFTGNGKGTDVAVRLKSSHSVVIKNCTATGLHSFIQNTSGWNLTIEDVTVTDSKSGLALGTVQGVTVKGCEVDVQGYGIRLDAQYNNNAVLESNKVKAFIPVVVRKASVNSNVTVQGTNEMTATNSDGLWCAVGTSEYEANGTMPTAATGKVSVDLKDANLPAEGVYGNYFGGTWGGIDWTLTNQGVLTIAPTAGEPVADKNAPTKRTYKVGEWREAVVYKSNGSASAIGGYPYDVKKVKKLIIKEGVTKIGSFTCQFPNLTGEVVIPSTVTYIGQEAFHKAPITSLVFAAGGTEPLCIANGAFKKTLIEEVSFPGDREYIHIHHWAFGGSPNLKTAYIPANVTKSWGGEHVDYFDNFNSQTNVTWAEYGSIFTGCTKMETITFENKEVRNRFFEKNRQSTADDYIVAAAGLVAYNTIEKAIAAAEDNDDVVLYKNCILEDTWTIPAGMNLTLNLNGKTLSQSKACTASYEMINNKGNLTITGNGKISFTDTSAGDPNFGWGSYTVRNEGTLVVENGTIEHKGAQAFGTHMICAIFQYSGSTTINGGTISTPNYRSARLWKGNMTINGGTFDGQLWVQAVDNSAKLTINGGTFEPNGNDASSVFVTNNQYDVALAVTDGTFNGKIGCSDATKLAGAIKGGKFNEAAKNGTNSALLAAGSVFGSEAGTDGYFTIVDDPSTHYIATLDDLKAFRDEVNSGANYYAGVNVYLAADIDMAGENWVGIGSATKDHGFMGNFDGQGYKIKNLTITDPALDADGYAYAGLFAVTEGKDKDNQNTIKNLIIENVTINTTGKIAAAAIAYPYYTIVDSVKVCGDIKIQGGDYTAGVLAYTRRCVNASNLSIVGNDGSFVKGNQTVGGVISDIQMNGGLTAVYKNFSAENLTITGAKQVGGISGIIATQTLNGATVKNVTLNSSDARVGIVAGCLGGTSTISNVTYENVTGAATLIGASYDNAKAVAAKIGDTYYATLEAALAAQGNEVELLATYEVAAGETKTLDLKGKTVTMVYTAKATKNHTMVSNSGNLTIESSVEGGKLSYTYAGENIGTSYSVNAVTSNPGSVLTVKSGTIENLTYDNSVIAYAIDGLTNGGAGDVTVNIEGGVITSKRQAVRIFANSTTNTGALNISGGDFTGRVIVQNASAKANKAALNITGGTFNANEYKTDVLYLGGSNSATIDINATVSGGTFNGEITETNVAGFISGGTYANPVVAQYCATGYMPNKNANGTYGVTEIANLAASINGFGYATLAEAIKAVKNGETITLLADCAENVTISQKSGLSFTIDGADKTYTGTINVDGNNKGAGLAGAGLTVKNVNFVLNGEYQSGIFTVKSSYACNITVDSCTFTGNDARHAYGIHLRTGYNIVVKNITGTKLYDLVYGHENVIGFTAENVTVTESNMGFFFPYGNNLNFKNVSLTGVNTGIGIVNRNSGTATFENCTINGRVAVNLAEAENVKNASTLVFKGENSFTTTEEWLTVSGTNATFKAVVEDASLDMTKTSGLVASIGNVYYNTLQKTVDAAKTGDTVALAANITLDAKKFVTQNDGYAVLVNVKEKDVTIDLNGKVITVSPTATDLSAAKSGMLLAVFHADINGNLTLTDNSAEATGAVNVTANDATVYSLGASESQYSDKSNSGKITVNGGKYNIDKARNCMFYADASNLITINGGNFYLGNTATGSNGSPWIFNTYGNNERYVVVTGGTFNTDVNHQYWAFEVKIDKTLAANNNGDGTWTIVPAAAYVSETFSSYNRNAGYATIEEAFAVAFARGIEVVTVAKDCEMAGNVTVPTGKTITLNLNGKTVTGTDNATGSYALITNKGNLTINGDGAIKLTATNNRGWNAYSSVISNTVGGKLTVNGGTIEHLGGTDMAYGIDNLTNGKGTYAETVVNGGTVKSAYRAIRQFLNGTEAQNILTVNDGTIEGANKSIWMQDPSKNANTGTLTVSEDASLNGDVYLTVTAGSTEWPVEVSIAAAALEDESKVLSSNVPAGYAVTNFDGVYSVEKLGGIGSELTIVDGEYESFSIELAEPVTIETLTYKRTFYSGVWNAIYVPFEIPVSALSDKYEIAYVNDIQALDKNEDGETSLQDEEITIEYVKIKNGVLRANYPYVIKPKKDTYIDLELVLNNAKLYGTSLENQTTIEISTAHIKFTIGGTYNKAGRDVLGKPVNTGDSDNFCLAPNKSGTWAALSASAKLTPFRIYMTMENKDDFAYIRTPENVEIRARVIGEKDEATGIITPIIEGDVRVNDGTIFDLMGRPVKTPEKGKIYIMNGKKVLF